jgi:hypothetical protein
VLGGSQLLQISQRRWVAGLEIECRFVARNCLLCPAEEMQDGAQVGVSASVVGAQIYGLQ